MRGVRWYVVWSFAPLDWIARVSLVFLTVYLVACIATGWAFGAGLIGFALGALLVVFAFTTNHFRMPCKRCHPHHGHWKSDEPA